MRDFANKPSQIIKQVTNNVEIFYGGGRSRRDVSLQVIRDLKERVEKVENLLKDSGDYLKVLPELTGVLERVVSVLKGF